jgi:hypothetical protein
MLDVTTAGFPKKATVQREQEMQRVLTRRQEQLKSEISHYI